MHVVETMEITSVGGKKRSSLSVPMMPLLEENSINLELLLSPRIEVQEEIFEVDHPYPKP